MAWTDDLGKVQINGLTLIGASFRGVSFFVEEAELSGGRRGVLHEYPKRDKPHKEDLGRKARGYPVTGYVVGDDVQAQKNRLLDALEESGSGLLHHPYYGRKRLAVADFTISETVREGRIARFSIQFDETSVAIPFVAGALSKAEAVKNKADKASSSIRAATAEIGDFGGLSGDFLVPAEELLAATAAAVNAPFSAIVATAEDAAAIRRRIDRMIEDAATLIVSPIKAFDALKAAFDVIFAPPTLPAAFAALLNSPEYDADLRPSPPVMTPSRVREAQLFDLIASITKKLVVIETAKIAATADFDLLFDATTVRESITAKLDELIAVEEDDLVWQDLTDLKDATIAAVPSPEKRPQFLATHKLTVTTPSLVVAHRLYGNIDREGEILARNPTPHAGFMIGGRELEYLASA